MNTQSLRTLLGLLLAFTLVEAQELKPPTDVPMIGKAPILLLEDFETTNPGSAPKGYQKQGAVGVSAEQAHTGRQSLKIEAATNGPRRITFNNKDVLKALGGTHWGRLWFKVEQPSPTPENGVIHSTLVGGNASSPLHKDGIEVRVLDTVMNKEGKYQYIYNVQPQKRPEFGKGGGYNHKFTAEWVLAEWYVDFATQTYRLFIDGVEVKDVAFMKGKDKFEGAEIPEVFDTLNFGWNNYQGAGKGFVAYIDDIALSKDRLGARGIVIPKKKS